MKRWIAMLLCLALLGSVCTVGAMAEADGNADSTVYLSDIEWQSWKMFGGTSEDANPPYRPSRDCNEAGGTLTIAGVEYEKGLRTHPGVNYDAEFVYDISPYKAKTFSAVVGKDSAGGVGNIKFIVVADGVTKAESPLLALGESYELTCDITGAKTLKLLVNEGDDGYGGDSAGWGNARLFDCESGIIKEPVEIPEDDGKEPMEKYHQWISDLSKLPVSFVYDGVSYSGLGGDAFTELERNVNEGKSGTQTVIKLKFIPGNLDITLNTVEYPAYHAYEWTVYFTNNTDQNTAQLSDIRGAELFFYGDAPVLSGINGDYTNLYSQYSIPLKEKKTFTNTSGRPSHQTFPYYNLQYGNGGTFIAVGWPGTYETSFEKLQNETTTATKLVAGQYNVNTYLKPGETIRTPLMAFVHYDTKDNDQAMNAWRHWFIDCNMRKINDQPFQPILTASTSWLYGCMTSADEQSQIDAIRNYQKYGIDLDYWWMDAGWYLGANNQTITALDQSGNWKVDPKRFPTLMKAISDCAAEYDMGTILWFEPELFRLSVQQILDTNPDFKAEWVLGDLANNGKLNDFGNPEFREWIFNTVSDILKTGGISIYRQDFNEHPGAVWAKNDAADRVGMTENQYCQGYLAYWDMLIEDDPNRMIDNCASGGGRLDLESMRRSVILHRSDMGVGDDNLNQSMSSSLAKWIVYFGNSTNDSAGDSINKNHLRSMFAPSMTFNYNINRESLNWPLLEALTEEWHTVSRFYYKDYYELLDWNRDDTHWSAWEYFDPAQNEGVIQVFRPSNGAETVTLKLKGLQADATYVLTDYEKKNDIKATGEELMNGYTVALERRGATTIYIGSEAIAVPDYAELEKQQGASGGYDLDQTIPEGAVYVSDLDCESWIMFGGNSQDANPPYRPSFNCNEAGGIIKIGDVEYAKGIRTHVSERTGTADLVFDISDLPYDTFRSVVGKDSAGLSGLAQFQVLVDDEIKAESPILNAGEAYQLTVNVKGGKKLTLRALDGGDTFTHDSIAWGSAILYNAATIKKAHEIVIEKINAIGTVTLESETAISDARKSFDSLSDEQKKLVINIAVLEAAEARLNGLKKEQSGKAAAKAVDDLIDAIGTVTLESQKAITDARTAYDALTDAQKNFVEKFEVLTAAEKRLQELIDDQNKIVYGDVNGDGTIDAKDALIVLKASVGKQTLNETETKTADVDGNGKLDAVDALWILKKSVKKVDRFPVEE